MSGKKHAADYRRRADQLRKLALSIADEAARVLLLRVANEYEVMAESRAPAISSFQAQ